MLSRSRWAPGLRGGKLAHGPFAELLEQPSQRCPIERLIVERRPVTELYPERIELGHGVEFVWWPEATVVEQIEQEAK